MIHIKSLSNNFLGHPHNGFSLLPNWAVHKWCHGWGKISKCWISSQDVLESFWRWLSGVLRVTGYWPGIDRVRWPRYSTLTFSDIIYGRPRQSVFVAYFFAKTWSEFNQIKKQNHNNKKKRKIKFRSTQKSLL
jgi:hypothetical protein